MKINKLDYVRTEAFNIDELTILQGLIAKQGYELDEMVRSSAVSCWLTYGITEEGKTAFYDDYFIEAGGEDITEKFREYLSNNESVITEKEFTKDDLKDGMVVTYRDGTRGLLFNGLLYYGFDEDRHAPLEVELTLNIDLNHGLTFDKNNETYNESYDIVKVEYMGKVLWERIEETPEQKRIKELEGIISEAQKELEGLRED